MCFVSLLLHSRRLEMEPPKEMVVAGEDVKLTWMLDKRYHALGEIVSVTVSPGYADILSALTVPLLTALIVT